MTVPGAIDAWAAILKAHGRFGLERALAPAIRFAEGGYPVAPRIASDWAQLTGKLRDDPGAARHYLFDGGAPAEGDVIRLPALAETLKTIAAKGPRAFYEGPIADDMAATVAARGSFLTADDFAAHRGDVVEPITTNYRGLDVFELPPNGQGLTALVLLNILEHFDLAALDPLGPDRFHIALEAARLAYAVRDTHIADPAFMRVPVPALIDKAFAAKLAARIDPARRVELPPAPAPGSDTVYLTVVDRDRMAVSLINTLFSSFGIGICTEQTGIMLHQPRRRLRGRSGASEYVRAAQAADAHDHPGARLARRPLRPVVRRHGRALPADGPRAGRHQHGRLRHGRAGGDRWAARLLRGRRDRGRARPAGGDGRRAEGARARRGGAAGTATAAARRSVSTGSAAC